VHYVPGEHDFLDEEIKFYRERYGRGAKGAGWYSFDASGVHFIGLVNVVDLKAGASQSRRRAAGMAGAGSQGPLEIDADRVFAISRCGRSIRNGLGHEDGARALDYLKGFAR